jgi:hypothetical protein
MARNMTDDERREFEEQTLHHGEGTKPPDLPASEADVVVDAEQPEEKKDPLTVPPNPD